MIAQTEEKYISFSKSILVDNSEVSRAFDEYIQLRFVDSFRFLPKSLDKLSKNLEVQQCNEVRKYFQLPSKEKFYNELTGESLSDMNYNRAIDVWNTFEC